MSESDTMFNERDRRCAAVQRTLSTDPNDDNRTIASTLKMEIWIATNNRDATIHRVFAGLPPALVEKACSQFRIRIEAVIEAEGGYFV